MEHPFRTVPGPPGAPDPVQAAMATVRAGPALAAAAAVDRAAALLCEGVLLLTGTALMGALTANVIARYVLATGGFDWAEEVPQQLFPWFIVAGVVLAVQRGLRGEVVTNPAAGFVLEAGDQLVLVGGSR